MKHNIKIAFRNARKNGIISFAKLFSLGLSFAIVIFAAVFAWYEKSFDKFVPDGDLIYRCNVTGIVNGANEFDVAVTAPALAEAIMESLPDIDETMRISSWGNADLEYEKIVYTELEHLRVDSNFFSFFDLSVKTNLKNPFESRTNMAISVSMAEKIFGTAQGAMDKRVNFKGEVFTISAVYEDFPDNFHLQYSIITTIKNFGLINAGWNAGAVYTYFKTTTPHINRDQLNYKITKAVYSNTNPNIDGEAAQTWDDLKFNEDTYAFYHAERLDEIHFSKHRYCNAITANKTYVLGAIILAILVLLISSLNYLNLSLAGISTRLKEIGVKKSNGAQSTNIFRQFLLENALFWLAGFLLAYVLLLLFAVPFKNYLGFSINVSGVLILKLIVISFFLLFVFNIIINVIPVVLISKTNVLKLLKDETAGNSKFSLRNFFVFLQFVFSGMIILGAIAVNKQINYMVNKDRGHDSENIIYVNMWDLGEERLKSFLNEMNSMPAIKGATACQEIFGRDALTSGARYEEADQNEFFPTAILQVDENFFETFDIEFLEGRPFNENMESDDETIIVNELAMKEYPGEGSVIDKNLLYQGRRRVIGVVKNFNFRSLHHELTPLLIVRTKYRGNVNIKINDGQTDEAIQFLRAKWKEFGMLKELDYQFVDDIVGKDYEKDKQAKKLLFSLSIISIIIACTGLYAISYFTILKKSKELAVRKINGATIMSIATQVSRTFMILVISAFVISIPVCVMLLKKWLQNFAYKTALDWWIFILAIGLTLLISLISIVWHVLKAATRNPVEALRYE